jgi:hypothetical protein
MHRLVTPGPSELCLLNTHTLTHEAYELHQALQQQKRMSLQTQASTASDVVSPSKKWAHRPF